MLHSLPAHSNFFVIPPYLKIEIFAIGTLFRCEQRIDNAASGHETDLKNSVRFSRLNHKFESWKE